MIKLSKMQAQAVINKLRREYNSLRDKLVEEARRNYTLSPNAKKAIELINKRDELKEQADKAAEDTREFLENLGIKGFFNYSKKEEALSKIKEKELKELYPPLDLNAALDNLIIAATREDFDINNFIESYLKQMKK